MEKANKITDSEWKVMEVIWEGETLRASEIVKDLRNETSWNDKTIRTLIDRLVDKKILGKRKEKVNMYYALVTKEQCVKEVTNTFINKIYKGSFGLLVSNFVKSNNLTKEDVSTLKELLKNNEIDNS